MQQHPNCCLTGFSSRTLYFCRMVIVENDCYQPLSASFTALVRDKTSIPIDSNASRSANLCRSSSSLIFQNKIPVDYSIEEGNILEQVRSKIPSLPGECNVKVVSHGLGTHDDEGRESA